MLQLLKGEILVADGFENSSSFAISIHSNHPQQKLALNQVSCCKLDTITHELLSVICHWVEHLKPIVATASNPLQVACESCDTCTRLLLQSWVVSNVSSPNAQSAPQKLQLWANVQGLAAAEQLCSCAKICCVKDFHEKLIKMAHCTRAHRTATVQPASTVKGDA